MAWCPKDAELLLIACNSIASTARQTVDALRPEGQPVGLIKLKQCVVTSPQITEVGPPYTTVNMTVSQTSTTGSEIGFNVGADATFRIANNFGIGVIVRYTGATVSLTPEGGESSEVKVGGFQFGGGLRIRF